MAFEWLDSRHYDALAATDRVGWAWAWLKRNPDYQKGLQGQDRRPVRSGPGDVGVIRGRVASDAGRWGVSFRR
uniref:transcriptional regulator domain-containing protein n=1 Tax=Asticcacaulis sp. DW145 TaxID=3095608 RepID=UPI00403F00B5